jgi:hypothetical protein
MFGKLSGLRGCWLSGIAPTYVSELSTKTCTHSKSSRFGGNASSSHLAVQGGEFKSRGCETRSLGERTQVLCGPVVRWAGAPSGAVTAWSSLWLHIGVDASFGLVFPNTFCCTHGWFCVTFSSVTTPVYSFPHTRRTHRLLVFPGSRNTKGVSQPPVRSNVGLSIVTRKSNADATFFITEPLLPHSAISLWG